MEASEVWREAKRVHDSCAFADMDAPNEVATAVIERALAQARIAALEEAAARIEALEAENARLRDALVQHNDRLRSAQMIASRDGTDTNWLTFRGQVTYTLAEYHELVNECRAALEGTSHD